MTEDTLAEARKWLAEDIRRHKRAIEARRKRIKEITMMLEGGCEIKHYEPVSIGEERRRVAEYYKKKAEGDPAGLAAE
jgi:hypothetical protein